MDGRSSKSGADDAGKGEHITSIDALRRRVPSIVKRVNADPALALRAAANPLLALDELGYTFPDALKSEIALRIRFDQPTIAKLTDLAAQIHKIAGSTFDIDSPTSLGRVLFEQLKLPVPPPVTQNLVVANGMLATREAVHITKAPVDPIAIPFKQPGGVKPIDPLIALKGKHPIVEPLLEYRAIQASTPALAPKALYDKIKSGDAGAPNVRIKAVLRRGATPE